MSRASVLARGRAAALAGMVDACAITRVTGHTTDPDTGVQTPTTETVYEGACRVQQWSPSSARPADVGEDYQLLQATELQLPIDATGVQVGDQVEMTASAHDLDLPGRVFRLR